MREEEGDDDVDHDALQPTYNFQTGQK